MGTNWTDITHYEVSSFYNDEDVGKPGYVSQKFYQNHQDSQETYDNIWNCEQGLKDAAEERKTMGIWKTIGGAFMVVVSGVACILATVGMSTPLVSGYVIGGVNIVFGVFDSTEGVQDIYYGSVGDISSTSTNMLKDVVFMGNEDAYYLVENVLGLASSAFTPIAKASSMGNLTFRSGTTIVAKETMAMVAGEAASELTMDLTGNRTISMMAGMMGSGLTSHGLNKVDAKFNISGNKFNGISQHENLDVGKKAGEIGKTTTKSKE